MARSVIEQSFKRSPIYRLGKKLRPYLNSLIAKSSEIGNAPVLNPACLPWTQQLESNWDIIRQEAEAVLFKPDTAPILRDISPDHRRIADDKWRSFFLWGYGYRLGLNCARCPETAKLVERIPDLNSAFFSILAPGAHIPRHRGVTKHLVTCHLGLIVPPDRDACWMTVGAEKVYWREGECLVFDDTYVHEVRNNTDHLRVILLIQVKRPSRFLGRVLGNLFLWGVRRSAFVQDARRNLETLQRSSQTGKGD